MLAALWIAAVLGTAIQATLQHTNNFETFRTSWFNLLAGRDLYGANPTHIDFFKYAPPFALLFAPIAVLPFWLGVLIWNGLNAGALYWALGRVLNAEQAFAARLIVLLDTVGSMQNVQSNALVAGLMIHAFADLYQRRELRASLAIGVGTIIKVFPIVAATFAIFRPYRLPRFAALFLVTGLVLLVAPLVLLTPSQLVEQYRSWQAISAADTVLDRGYSVMQLLHLLSGRDWPSWPFQLLGAAVLVAPLARLSYWGLERFRLLYLASVLMFCVLFNHKAESPTFVIALAGVAIWFAVSRRDRFAWAVLGVVVVGTILAASDAMPRVLQARLFEPYRLKTVPVLLVWVLTQWELWRAPQIASARPPAPGDGSAIPAT